MIERGFRMNKKREALPTRKRKNEKHKERGRGTAGNFLHRLISYRLQWLLSPFQGILPSSSSKLFTWSPWMKSGLFLLFRKSAELEMNCESCVLSCFPSFLVSVVKGFVEKFEFFCWLKSFLAAILIKIWSFGLLKAGMACIPFEFSCLLFDATSCACLLPFQVARCGSRDFSFGCLSFVLLGFRYYDSGLRVIAVSFIFSVAAFLSIVFVWIFKVVYVWVTFDDNGGVNSSHVVFRWQVGRAYLSFSCQYF